MNRVVLAGLTLVTLLSPCWADDGPAMPKPTPAHAWLEKLVGEWDADSEMLPGPGQPPLKAKGTEKIRMHGGFWLIAEAQADVMGTKVNSVLTLGYDPDKKKYVGTWIDNCHHHLWRYEGSLDDAGKVLTLDTEGPHMMIPGKTAKYREVITLVGPDEKTFTSSVLGDDGTWFTFVKANYKRKK